MSQVGHTDDKGFLVEGLRTPDGSTEWAPDDGPFTIPPHRVFLMAILGDGTPVMAWYSEDGTGIEETRRFRLLAKVAPDD